MAILRGGNRIGGYDIRIGIPRDRSLDNVAGDTTGKFHSLIIPKDLQSIIDDTQNRYNTSGYSVEINSKLSYIGSLEIYFNNSGTAERWELAEVSLIDGVKGTLDSTYIPWDNPAGTTYDIADEMMKLKSKEDDSIGLMDGEEIFIKTGRFGSYLKCGDKTKGFPPNIDSDNIDEQMAIKIMSLPIIIGKNPDNGSDVQVDIGKFGPYIRSGKNTKSIPASEDIFNLTLEKALEILKSKQYP